MVFLTVQLTTTASGNSQLLATLSGVPRPKANMFSIAANGSTSQALCLHTDLMLKSSGSGFTGGGWLACTIAYCS